MRRTARIKDHRTSAPLGSLTQTGGHIAYPCRSCGSARITRIEMALTDGSPVEFTSCHTCEKRSWHTVEGERLTVASVLERTRKRT